MWSAIIFFLLTWTATTDAVCSEGGMAVYRLELSTNWTKDRFPRHFPDNRPKAQWSKTFGQTHNASSFLYKLGEEASLPVTRFTELGEIDLLVEAGEGNTSVYDQFIASAVASGEGKTRVVFFVDPQHSLVSMMTHLIPSPDWFVGVDSFDLCVASEWLDAVSLTLTPLDAGTDNGLTFTSPSWATRPAARVTRLTPRSPQHPAAAFYEPDRLELPSMATVRFVKIKEYTAPELVKLFHQEARKTFMVENKDKAENKTKNKPENRTENETEYPETIEITPASLVFNTAVDAPPTTENFVLKTSLDTEAEDILRAASVGRHPRHFRSRLSKSLKRLTEGDCAVSQWGEWSSCSASCEFGRRSRRRRVLRPQSGGRKCPPLEGLEPCGAVGNCGDVPYFEW